MTTREQINAMSNRAFAEWLWEIIRDKQQEVYSCSNCPSWHFCVMVLSLDKPLSCPEAIEKWLEAEAK